MNFDKHILITLVFGSTVLFILDIFSFKAILILVMAGLAIDLDHILYYIILQKHISFKGFYEHDKYHFKKKTVRFLIFHTLEFNIILFYFARQNFIVFLVFLGFLIHLLSDQIDTFVYKKNVFIIKKWIALWHIKKKIST